MKRIALTVCAIAAALLLTSSKPVRVACIGDSITYGVGVSDRDSDSYPSVLGKMLGNGYEVRNFGFSARVMCDSGDHPYMAEDMYSEVKAYLPDIVTIMLGTNDTKPWNFKDGAALAEYENCYLRMVDELKALPSHPRIYVCNPVPIFENSYGIRDSIATRHFVPVIRKVAARKWLDLVDTYSPLDGRNDLFPDGVHPNEAGAKLIAQTIFDAFSRRADTGKPARRVLFIGDSITDDDWGKADGKPTAKRQNYDMNHIYGHGYVFEIAVQTQSKHPEKRYTFYNRGISGNRLTDLEARWDEDVFPVHPDIVSLLIGVNDVWRKAPDDFDYAGWEARYRALIDKTLAFDPEIKFVLGTPFCANVGQTELNDYYQNLSIMTDRLAVIVRRIAADYGFTLTDYAILFDELISKDKSGDSKFWTWDGIHPTMVAHKRMADLWIRKTAKIMK